MSTKPPETLGQERPPRSRGTVGDTTAARRPPSPPLYRAGTGREPGDTTPQPWLAEKVETSRRAARPQPCRHCSATLLVGPDHDTCSMTARVDPDPVDQLTEVAALLTGRASYDLVRGDLHYRYPEHHHSASRPYPVLLEHRCHPETPMPATPTLFEVTP